MVGLRDGHTKSSMSERERQISDDNTYMWNLNYDTNEFIYEIETDLQLPWSEMVREGWIGSLGLAYANYYLWNR